MDTSNAAVAAVVAACSAVEVVLKRKNPTKQSWADVARLDVEIRRSVKLKPRRYCSSGSGLIASLIIDSSVSTSNKPPRRGKSISATEIVMEYIQSEAKSAFGFSRRAAVWAEPREGHQESSPLKQNPYWTPRRSIGSGSDIDHGKSEGSRGN